MARMASALMLLVLLSTGLATRTRDVAHGNESSTAEMLPKRAKYGEACTCGSSSPGFQRCCGEGLVCSRSSNTCKPALGAQCTPSSIPYYTDCAKSTYHKDIRCEPDRRKAKGGRCCIKSGDTSGNIIPHHVFVVQPCCSGYQKRKGRYVYCQEKPGYSWSEKMEMSALNYLING
mmetsp:Transcript_20137/g.33024  ORF Transcript_20137/g.33024 Transcript_20137/m.33024 type:complete len:175 (+) Transcript_20137:55-579(+)